MMRRLGFGLLIAMLSFACGPASEPESADAGTPAPSDARAALFDAHEGWVSAFEDSDVEALVGYLEPSGRFLLFHPEVDGRYHNADEVRAGLARMFESLGDPAWTEVHLEGRVEGTVGWLTYHLVLESTGGGAPFLGRGTEIWVLHPNGWRLAHAHLSPRPEESS